MANNRYKWVVVYDHPERGTNWIGAVGRDHAEYIYGTMDHATIERWDMATGVVRTIKSK